MSTKPRYTGTWGEIDCQCDLLNKPRSTYHYVTMMFDRTSQMFEYKGLPDTIPQYMLELFLQINGHVGLVELNSDLYALPGHWGGAPDPYYRPTMYTIANPALGIGEGFRIENHMPPYDKTAWEAMKPCVLMRNDTNMRGLFYLFTRYATQMTENDISIRSAQINARQQTFISAGTDREVASAQAYLDGIEKGRIIAVAERPFLEGMKTVNVATQASNAIIQLIELQQYLKASWFNEIGLNANFNMKREYLSEEEIRSSTDILLPLIDDMLIRRQEALDVVNSTFGTNISVDKNSAWDNKQEEVDTAQDKEEAEIDSLKSEGGESPNE